MHKLKDYRANKYVARMLGDAAALKDDKGATGVFWAHAWDMLNARMSYSGNTKMWQTYMCEVDPAKTQELNALSSRKLDALIKVGICLEPALKKDEFSERGVLPSDVEGINEMVKRMFKEKRDETKPAPVKPTSPAGLLITASEKYLGLGYNDEMGRPS